MKRKVKGAMKSTWAIALAAALCFGTVIPATLMNTHAEELAPTISTEAGNLESAYVEWKESAAATGGYEVYVKKAADADSAYTKLDNELVRRYSDGTYRADAVGLAAGEYVMKVVPFVGDAKDESKAVVSKTLTVEAHDRSGFAWVNGTSSGAYNEDGTLKSNAVVLYVTEKTKDTVSCEVVTSAKGTIAKATGIQAILDLVKKGYDSRPFDIRMVGEVTDPTYTLGGDLVIDESSKDAADGITFEGIGKDATANGWGLRIKNASNVEVRNIGFMNCNSSEGDNVGLQQDNNHVWVHNCDMFYGNAGSDADQVKGDGALDCKLSTYVTFSYNHFWDNGKCNLLGLSEGTTEGLYITYQHNWYDHSDSRHPRVRYYTAHVYNNYYDGNAKYGVGATSGSSIFVENNYFRNCKYPMLMSMQGSDVWNESTQANDYKNMGTFSSECAGVIKAFGNTIIGAQRFVPYSTDATEEFDAIVVDKATDTVSSDIKANMATPSSISLKKGSAGNTYNNFDTSSVMYSYTAQSAEDAKTTVEKYAGRVQGGDFKWTFNNSVDDESYLVNAELKAALVAYKTSLDRVGGRITGSIDPTTAATTAGATTATTGSTTATTAGATTATTAAGQTAGTQVQNFTTDGISSSFYTITGNLSDSKGTVTYAGLTLTQALKMESATNITFTAPSAGKLTLVFGGSTVPAGKTVKVNGTKYTVGADNTVTVDVPAGSNTVIKGDSINLFYMVYAGEGAVVPTTAAPTTSATTAAGTTTPTTTSATEPTTQAPTVTPIEGAVGMVTNLSTYKDSDFKSVLYVSPTGKADAAGTKAAPLDLETAITKCAPGMAILMMDGTYTFDHQVTIPYGNNGTADAYKVIRACDGAKVTLDFSSQVYGDTATNARGLQMEGNYWYVYGITAYKAADNGIFVAGKHNVVERCVMEANRDSGLQISRRNSSLSDMADWPSDNLILNCTSFDSYDPKTGENADGFASKLTCGEGNVFDGCISYSNCDDGWDLYSKSETGSIGVVTIRNCVAFNNGKLTSGASFANGDMNGFKLGGNSGKTPTNHIVTNCLAFGNGKDGFTDNGNGGALQLTNLTSVNNVNSNLNFYRTNNGAFNNLVSYYQNMTPAQNDKFVGTITNSTYMGDKSKKNYYFTGLTASTIANGDKLGTIKTMSDGLFVNAAKTIDPTSHTIDKDYRNADGTINMFNYLQNKDGLAGAAFGTKAASTVTVKVASEQGTTVAPTTATPTTAAPTTSGTTGANPTTSAAQPTTAVGTAMELNVTNMTNATITEPMLMNGFGILASANASVIVEANTKGDYTKRLKLGGAGSTTERAVVLKTVGASTITVAAMSSSGSATRTFNLLDAAGNIVDSHENLGGASLETVTFNVSKAGTYYLVSAEGGINIYDIKITNGTPVSLEPETTAAPTTVAPTTVAPTAPTTGAPATTEAPTDPTTGEPVTTDAATTTVAGTTVAPTTAGTTAGTTTATTAATVAAGNANGGNTGDSSNAMLYIVIMLMAAGFTTVAVYSSKKKRS